MCVRVRVCCKVVAEVRALGLWENTLWVLHSDNGGEIMGAGLCGGNNWPLRGQSALLLLLLMMLMLMLLLLMLVLMLLPMLILTLMHA